MGTAASVGGAGLPTANDETITWALDRAVIPPLLAALATALDDPSLIPDHLRPGEATLIDHDAGLSENQKAEARTLAHEALRRWRDLNGGATEPSAPNSTILEPVLHFLGGGRDVDGYLGLMREELALGEDPRAPAWRREDVAPDRTFRVAVIGAGMSGLAAAHRLSQAGLDVTILEKNHDVGGTWLDNSYPGCRVDVHNHFYSYTFAPRKDWPSYFSSQDVLLDYFRDVADQFGLRELIRFGTEVSSMAWDDTQGLWRLDITGPDGPTTVEAEAVVSAVGQLNQPKMPDIAGLDRFTGPRFHSARWDHNIDLTGKRVAVIGTGASAAQFVPEIVSDVAQLTVFQRTPGWFLPSPDYHTPVSDQEQWLFHNVPGYVNWYRFWLFWANVEGLMPAAAVDADWAGNAANGDSAGNGDSSGAQAEAAAAGPGRSEVTAVSEANELMRQILSAYIETEFADRPDLLANVVPDYPPFAKRAIRDNGAWPAALKQPHVTLVTDAIEEVTPLGVSTGDELYEVDVIIYGTGFAASDFLTPMQVAGRDGVDLHEHWAGDARAHLGVTLPDFPNLFLLYGPNTNIVVNGSITYFTECEVNHVVGCLEAVLRQGAKGLEPDRAAHDDYNARIDAENLRMAWGVSSVNSWYKSESGRSAQNWPFSLLDYWRMTRHVDLDQYRLLT